MNFIKILADIVCKTLLDPEVLDKSRTKKGAFTRNCKKLPYWSVIKLLMKNVKKTISSSLDEFFSEIANSCGNSYTETIKCSQQAFSKARKGVNHTLFKECFNRVLDFLCNTNSHEFHKRLNHRWGLQIIAIDGSKIPLPNRKELLESYGSIGRAGTSPTAIASIAYDVLNTRIIDAEIDIMSVDERTLAVRHMESIINNKRADSLYTIFVFDRGYCSKKLISFIEDDIKSRYLFRLRSKFNNDIDALTIPESNDIGDYIVYLEGRKTRVLKFLLPSGIVETLITNDFGTDKSEFPRIYALRWPVEETYKLIKEKVGLTNFRGYTKNSILQEFWISVLLANLSLAIKRETDAIIDETINKGDNKHKYQTNMNELAGVISRNIDKYMDAETNDEKMTIIRHIFDFAIRHRVINKKGTGESYPRIEPRKVKHHYNNKATH